MNELKQTVDDLTIELNKVTTKINELTDNLFSANEKIRKLEWLSGNYGTKINIKDQTNAFGLDIFIPSINKLHICPAEIRYTSIYEQHYRFPREYHFHYSNKWDDIGRYYINKCLYLTELKIIEIKEHDCKNLMILKRCAKITHITLESLDNLEDIDILSTFDNLRYLWIYDCSLIKSFKFLENCANLETLHIELPINLNGLNLDHINIKQITNSKLNCKNCISSITRGQYKYNY